MTDIPGTHRQSDVSHHQL